ncbi:hypothetical protein ACFFX0_29325 [Citricoccus parietis]|uniref:Uncharacterized protein n=1 Tax=Citricoccus parietis TaxID=592307 RepID=A0ABV5G4J8_9MICC
MDGDVICGKPRLSHVGPPSLYGPGRPTPSIVSGVVPLELGLFGRGRTKRVLRADAAGESARPPSETES